MSTKNPLSDLGNTRTLLALGIVVLGVLGIIAISWVAIAGATSTGAPEMTRLVFASVLPLIGTWVGTVIAFYFSRDNLIAASQTTLAAIRAAGGLSEDDQVTTAMTPYNSILRKDVKDADEAKALKLSDLYDLIEQSGLSRVPIFADRKALYVVHEPDIDKYAQGATVASASLPAAATLGALLSGNDEELKKAVETFAAVAGTATVADARRALASVAEAKDLFVTDDGKTTGNVLGWLTNSDLARS